MLLLGQYSDSLWRAWLYVTHTRSLAIALGIGFAILAISLLVASRTRWGQAKPLTKCVVLSVLAHVWLLMYALGSREVLPQGSPDGRETSMSVAFESDAAHFLPQVPSLEENLQESESKSTADTSENDFAPQPWERTAALGELPQPASLREALAKSDLTPPGLLPVTEPTPLPPLPPQDSLADLLPDEPTRANPSNDQPTPTLDVANNTQPEQPDPIAIQAIDSPPPASVLPPAAMANLAALDARPVSADHSPILPPEMQLPADSQLPPEYQLRQAANRLQLATAYGADQDSEAAVEAGLAWLAAAQSSDGSWNAKQFGAGTETHALGESRYGTGDKADTGVSGLALLAFLSAGHTHVQGKHQKTVELGLSYLLRAQWSTGDLSGPKQVGQERSVLNARMYCHSIATLALAEAHVMTGDVVLHDSLMRAAQYSINAQDTRGGGWRYRPGDSGDLSQFGWQAMALKSVQRSGIHVPAVVTQRMHSFLDSCSTGTSKGLFTYRPREGRPSETMTAEGFACRLFLDDPMSLAAQKESLKMIMDRRPGVGEDNVYFWYYATLALFQLQDQNWRDWNQALKQRLLSTQEPVYSTQAGSWTPDHMWGGYGGRVYSTAMSCLCLEVYYRYLPMYQHANIARSQDPYRAQR
ncbi:MAG: hypothetical protein IT422_11580 [Pirellulaceae bacterium]|nr:hypothetical protein [Pirellulaceae bacterium]